jgi:hypothetical protein
MIIMNNVTCCVRHCCTTAAYKQMFLTTSSTGVKGAANFPTTQVSPFLPLVCRVQAAEELKPNARCSGPGTKGITEHTAACRSCLEFLVLA